MEFQIQNIDTATVTLRDLLLQKWNLRDPENVLNLLKTLIPGDWNIRHATRLVNTMLGGKHFNPLLIVTDDSETTALLSHLRTEFLATKLGVDPCA